MVLPAKKSASSAKPDGETVASTGTASAATRRIRIACFTVPSPVTIVAAQPTDRLVIKTMQPPRIGGQDLAQQFGVVVDVTIEQFDDLRIIHHPLFAPAGMRPVGAPDQAIGSRLDERSGERYRVVPTGFHDGVAIAIRELQPPSLLLQGIKDPAHCGLVKAKRKVEMTHVVYDHRETFHGAQEFAP